MLRRPERPAPAGTEAMRVAAQINPLPISHERHPRAAGLTQRYDLPIQTRYVPRPSMVGVIVTRAVGSREMRHTEIVSAPFSYAGIRLYAIADSLGWLAPSWRLGRRERR